MQFHYDEALLSVTCHNHAVYVGICSNISKNKEKYISRSEKEVDYLKKGISVFNILVFLVHKRLMLKLLMQIKKMEFLFRKP